MTIKAKADWKISLEWLVRATRPDDPVLFNLTLEPTSNKYEDIELKLSELNLNEIYDITSANIMEGVVKTRKISSQLE